MASVTIVYRKDKLNQKGEAPIHFRIIKDRKISYITSGIMLAADLWDEEKSRVKSKHPNSKRFNSFLANRYAKMQDEVFEHETLIKGISSRKLKDKVMGKKPSDFFPFAETANEAYLRDGKVGTYDKNRAIIAKLKRYVKEASIAFQDIDPDFLKKYELYLKTELGNTQNTVHKDFKFIRKLFNDACREELVEVTDNPFPRYQMKTTKTQRTYLTEDELKAIEECEATPGTRMELHRDMFVFAAYAGGLRISDMLQLQWKHFDGANINFTIKKTGNQLSIKVPNKGLEIIKKYKPAKKNSNAFLFPMLSNTVNLDEPRELDSAISAATAYINKNINILAGKAGIDKRVSFHSSRHTWATRALRKGISIDKVSKLMGHAAIRETQIYAKIVNEELDKAMDVFND